MFVNLHNHTSYSDGASSPEKLILAAKSLGQDAVGITDHGTVSGWFSFMRYAKKHDVKPILGQEFYLFVDIPNKFAHITLLAKNKVGFENIIKLSNAGHASRFKKPAVTLEQIIAHKDGVIVLSGCVNGYLSFGKKYSEPLIQAFGEDFYIEVMFPYKGSHTKPMEEYYELKKKYNWLKIVFTSDAHYPRAEHAYAYNKLSYIIRGYSIDNDNLYLHSENEVVEKARLAGLNNKEINEGVKTSVEIANKVEVFDISYKMHLPTPRSARREVKSKAWDTLDSLENIDYNEYADRLKYELKIIRNMDFFNYFWMVSKIVEYAKKNNISIGPGRGSAAGSLFVYLLGITQVDPIKYGLIFERFLNPERHGWPDIDIDVQADRRKEIIEFAEKEWGAKPITTFITYKHKNLVNDLAKVFGIPEQTRKDIVVEGSNEFNDYMKSNSDFKIAYELFDGAIRNKGQHASGFAVGTNDVVPMERMKGGVIGVPLASSAVDDLTPLGLIKFDLLGLNALSALSRMKELAHMEDVK